MQRLNLHEAAPGMVLAEPVLDPEGRILIQEGTALTAALLDRLNRWNIAAISVRGEHAGAGAKARAGDPPEARWQRLFSRQEDAEECRILTAALAGWLHGSGRSGAGKEGGRE